MVVARLGCLLFYGLKKPVYLLKSKVLLFWESTFLISVIGVFYLPLLAFLDLDLSLFLDLAAFECLEFLEPCLELG